MKIFVELIMNVQTIIISFFLPSITISATFAQSDSFTIQPIQNQVVPYPHSLLLPLQTAGTIPAGNIEFTYQSDVTDAVIRGQSIYWKPEVNDVGRHQFKIIAAAPNGETATTVFMVDVRPFNAPPRFIPLRRITIPAGISYHLPIKAIDPDGMNKYLIRYLGINLPQGASINEQSGAFEWTPTLRQTGDNTFRIIATDQYGAASSITITIRVVQAQNG